MATKKPAPTQEPSKALTIPKEIIFSCPDWESKIERGEVPASLDKIEPYLNQKRVKAALEIFDNLRLPDVVGQPYLRDACGDWFRQIVRAASGSLHVDPDNPENMIQLINSITLMVPKKNSKTTFGAALLLTLFLIAPRPRSTYILIAPSLAIADLAMSQIEGFILLSPELKERLLVKSHSKRIEDKAGGGILMVKSWDKNIVTGVKATYLLDEAWLLNSPESSKIVGQLKGGQASLPEAQAIVISTMSDSTPTGYWDTELNKTRGIREATLPIAGYLPVLYEPPKQYAKDLEKVTSDKVFKMTNPNIGRSVSLDWLKSSWIEARSAGATEQMRWLSQHVNAAVTGLSLGDESWGGGDYWMACGDDNLTLDGIMGKCNQFAFGFDGGSIDDLSSLAVCGRDEDNHIYIWVKCWLANTALGKRKIIAGELDRFIKDGDLEICEVGDDINQAAEIVINLYNHSGLATFAGVGVDPAGPASDFAYLCVEGGVPERYIFNVSQGVKLAPHYNSLERFLARGAAHHCNQPILAWCVQNAKRAPSGLITKMHNGRSKIDALVASTVAVATIMQSPHKPVDIGAMIACF